MPLYAPLKSGTIATLVLSLQYVYRIFTLAHCLVSIVFNEKTPHMSSDKNVHFGTYRLTKKRMYYTILMLTQKTEIKQITDLYTLLYSRSGAFHGCRLHGCCCSCLDTQEYHMHHPNNMHRMCTHHQCTRHCLNS